MPCDIDTFNNQVEVVILFRRTYSLETKYGTLKIEAGDSSLDQKYCGWWDHDHSQMFYGETPYDVYSDLLSGAKECGSN